VDGNQLGVRLIVELDGISGVSAYLVSAECLSSGNIPNDESVIVLATKRCEILLIVRESKALNQDLVELKALNNLKGIKVPNNDVSLEAHVCLLTTGNVFPCAGNSDHRDVVIVTSEELLSSGDNVSNDDGCTEGIDDVLVVGVKSQSVNDLTLEANHS